MQNISKKVLVSGWAPTRLLISQVKTGFGSGLSLSMSLFHRSKKMQHIRKEQMLGKCAVVVENMTETGRIFLPKIYGVCMYKSMDKVAPHLLP